MSSFIFDTETSGLPTGGRFPSYKDDEAYSTCRIVSICWIVLNPDLEEEECKYFLIKPDGFIIPQSAINIHGITNEEANANGVRIESILDELTSSLERCDNLVGHNISFDFGVLLNEMYRLNMHDVISRLFSMERICTMKRGKEVMKMKKWPKLTALYEYLTEHEMIGAHNAQADTKACAVCYRIMYKIPPPSLSLSLNLIKSPCSPQLSAESTSASASASASYAPKALNISL